jgi:hypothetical protein
MLPPPAGLATFRTGFGRQLPPFHINLRIARQRETSASTYQSAYMTDVGIEPALIVVLLVIPQFVRSCGLLAAFVVTWKSPIPFALTGC